MKTGIPLLLVLSLVPNNSAAKINHELEKLVDRKVEASVERFLTSMKMAAADDSASRFEDLEYDNINLKEKIEDLNQKLAEVRAEAAVQKSVFDTQTKNFMETFQELKFTFEAKFVSIENRLQHVSATEQTPTGSESLAKLKDDVAKLQIVQELIQTKQSEMNDQIDSNIELGETLVHNHREAVKGHNYQTEVNQDQSMSIAKLEIFLNDLQDTASENFPKIVEASNKVQMIEARVDSVDAEMLRIRDAFQNQFIPVLQSIFKDKVVEETTAYTSNHRTGAFTRITEPEIMTRPIDTTRPDFTSIPDITPTPPGWKTPGDIPTTEDGQEVKTGNTVDTTENTTKAQLTKTSTAIPTPPGWKTPADTPKTEDGSGEVATTKETETTKNGEKQTTRIPDIDLIEISTKPEISDSKIPEVTPDGWSTPGDVVKRIHVNDFFLFDVTSVKNGSGSADDLSESSDDEELRETEFQLHRAVTEMGITKPTSSESTEATPEPALESSKANTEYRIKNQKLSKSIGSILNKFG